MQEIITYIIVAFAFGYVAFKAFRMVRVKPAAACGDTCTPCSGCSLKDTCKITSANLQSSKS